MELKELLSQTDISYDTVLDRFSNNEALLKKFLLRFPSDETYGMLKKSVEEMNFDGVEKNAHTLKGLSGNFGFEKLSKLCGEMVLAVRENDRERIQPLFAEITKEYDLLLNCIGKIE